MSRKRFRYKILVTADSDFSETESKLNALGDYGWELVSTSKSPIEIIPGNVANLIWTFKRKIDD